MAYTQNRRLDVYDVVRDAGERHPGWRLEVSHLHGIPELVCLNEKLILVDSLCWKYGAEHGWAHALAHLDLGHHLEASGCFTRDHEALADTLAEIRMDRECP